MLGPKLKLSSTHRPIRFTKVHRHCACRITRYTKDWSIRLSNREKLGMDQVFVVWTSKSGLNQMGLVF